MVDGMRVAALLGVLLLLGGGWAVAGDALTGSGCDSGYQLSIDRVTGNESVDTRFTHRAFAALAPVDQRIFLEAYTDDNGLSRFYDTPTPLSNVTDLAVTYRNHTYTTHLVVADCAPDTRRIFGGVIAVGLGSLVLLVTGGWWVYTR